VNSFIEDESKSKTITYDELTWRVDASDLIVSGRSRGEHIVSQSISSDEKEQIKSMNDAESVNSLEINELDDDSKVCLSPNLTIFNSISLKSSRPQRVHNSISECKRQRQKPLKQALIHVQNCLISPRSLLTPERKEFKIRRQLKK
jgi:hypothetical protein